MARKERRKVPGEKKKQWGRVCDGELLPQLPFPFSDPHCRQEEIKFKKRKREKGPLVATFHVS